MAPARRRDRGSKRNRVLVRPQRSEARPSCAREGRRHLVDRLEPNRDIVCCGVIEYLENGMRKSIGEKNKPCKNCEGKGTLKERDKVVRCQRCGGTGIRPS
jgi:hypothetical protein